MNIIIIRINIKAKHQIIRKYRHLPSVFALLHWLLFHRKLNAHNHCQHVRRKIQRPNVNVIQNDIRRDGPPTKRIAARRPSNDRIETAIDKLEEIGSDSEAGPPLPPRPPMQRQRFSLSMETGKPPLGTVFGHFKRSKAMLKSNQMRTLPTMIYMDSVQFALRSSLFTWSECICVCVCFVYITSPLTLSQHPFALCYHNRIGIRFPFRCWFKVRKTYRNASASAHNERPHTHRHAVGRDIQQQWHSCGDIKMDCRRCPSQCNTNQSMCISVRWTVHGCPRGKRFATETLGRVKSQLRKKISLHFYFSLWFSSYHFASFGTKDVDSIAITLSLSLCVFVYSCWAISFGLVRASHHPFRKLIFHEISGGKVHKNRV